MNPLLNKDPSQMRQIDIVKIYGNKRCLIVDDFPEIRGSLGRALRLFGCASVDTAAGGEDAIKLCSAKKYDIVLCDYNLGAGKDGQQVLEEVRFLRVLMMTSTFIMITGESSRHMVLGALECQPDDYITKPYTEASLKLRLNKAIVRHEALIDIKTAISKGDYREALGLCNSFIDEGHRYASDCVKMKGQLYFLLNQLNDAQALYESVLAKKPVIWARLGMAKVQMELGRNDAAETLLKEVIDEDERYVEAHDMLGELRLAKEDLPGAQRAVEDATRISPKSVLRHRKLAKISEQNHDNESALKSHQQSIKWGMNSCHESEQDYFNYARKVSDIIKGDESSESRVLAKNANTLLERARKRYADKHDVAIQAQMVETQLLNSEGKGEAALKSLEKSKRMYNELAAPATGVSIEYARSLYAMGDRKQAREILVRLAARHEGNKEIMDQIDRVLDEPISEAGKKLAAELTKKGIDHYDNQDFEESIEVFNEALNNYPKHIGLNLNLVQAIIAKAETEGFQEKHESMIKRALQAVGNIEGGHKQFSRFNFLINQLEKHYPETLVYGKKDHS